MASQPIDFSDLGGKVLQSPPAKKLDFSDLGGKELQASPQAVEQQQHTGFFPALADSAKNLVQGQLESWEHGSGVMPGVQQGQTAVERGETFNPFHPVDTAGYLVPQPIKNAYGHLKKGEIGAAIGGLLPPVASQATALLSPAALAEGLHSPLGKTVNTPRGTIPAEGYSPAELKSYADANGIPANAAVLTEHNLPRNLQSAGERASVGGTEVRAQSKATQAAVAEHAEKLADSYSPNTPDLASAGDAIKQNTQAALDRELEASRQAYSTIDKQANGVTVDLKPLKQTAQDILDKTDFVRQVSALDPTRASAILKGIKSAPDNATFTQAQQLRSALLDASRSPDLAISNQAQAWIKQLTGTVDDQMINAASTQPGLARMFRDANEHWKGLQDSFNNPRSPLAQILAEPDPSKIPQKLTQRGQTGGSPYNAGLMDQWGIDKGPVKQAIVRDLMGKDFRLWNKHLGGYSDEFLQSVFSPDELADLYKTGMLARSAGLNTNPSGTAGVTSAISDVQSPLKSLLPKGIAARATKSPGFNDWLMTAPGKVTSPKPVPLSTLLGIAGAGRKPEDDR